MVKYDDCVTSPTMDSMSYLSDKFIVFSQSRKPRLHGDEAVLQEGEDEKESKEKSKRKSDTRLKSRNPEEEKSTKEEKKKREKDRRKEKRKYKEKKKREKERRKEKRKYKESREEKENRRKRKRSRLDSGEIADEIPDKESKRSKKLHKKDKERRKDRDTKNDADGKKEKKMKKGRKKHEDTEKYTRHRKRSESADGESAATKNRNEDKYGKTSGIELHEHTKKHDHEGLKLENGSYSKSFTIVDFDLENNEPITEVYSKNENDFQKDNEIISEKDSDLESFNENVLKKGNDSDLESDNENVTKKDSQFTKDNEIISEKDSDLGSDNESLTENESIQKEKEINNGKVHSKVRETRSIRKPPTCISIGSTLSRPKSVATTDTPINIGSSLSAPDFNVHSRAAIPTFCKSRNPRMLFPWYLDSYGKVAVIQGHFTREESRRVQKALDDYCAQDENPQQVHDELVRQNCKRPGAWKVIAFNSCPYRSVISIYRHGIRCRASQIFDTSPWTKDDHMQLQRLVKVYGHAWVKIQNIMNRSHAVCERTYHRSKFKNFGAKGRWTLGNATHMLNVILMLMNLPMTLEMPPPLDADVILTPKVLESWLTNYPHVEKAILEVDHISRSVRHEPIAFLALSRAMDKASSRSPEALGCCYRRLLRYCGKFSETNIDYEEDSQSADDISDCESEESNSESEGRQSDL